MLDNKLKRAKQSFEEERGEIFFVTLTGNGFCSWLLYVLKVEYVDPLIYEKFSSCRFLLSPVFKFSPVSASDSNQSL